MVVTWVLVLYALAILGALIWGSVIAARFKGNLKHFGLPESPPLVSTIVPARNEERNIGRCASGLVQQDYPHLQLIFVDDDSSDRTGEILAEFSAQDPRVEAINTGGKPADWNGKQWACWSGAQKGTGEWLCFMDADTYAEPHLLSRTVAFALANNIDMLTLQPWYEMRGLWERIVLPASLPHLLLIFPPEVINNPKKRLSMANGQFILIRRTAYEAIDGHRGVKNMMMDDFSLAEHVKRAGFRLFIVEGSEVMRVRLYSNLKEIHAGAIKAAVQLTGGWLTSLVGLGVNFLLNVMPPVFLLWMILINLEPGILIIGGAVSLQLVYYSAFRMLAFRIPPWSGITYPLGGLVATIIMLDGLIRVARGGEIKWKGRDVQGRPELVVPAVPRERDKE